MKQFGNFDSKPDVLYKEDNFNSVTGGYATVATPDQLGINITKSVFGWQGLGSGPGKTVNGGLEGANQAANQAIDTYGMPFKFVVNGQQILLPPVVQSGGTPVPPLPDGLTVVYAPSFMGVAIPSDMIRPISVNGKLRMTPIEMPSAQNWRGGGMSGNAVGSWTNDMLNGGYTNQGVNHGRTLMLLIEAAMECLIYSYSSYPWGNGYNDLSDAIMTKRSNYDDFLIYPYQKGTFLGSIIKDVAPVFTSVAGIVAPGSQGTVASGLNAIENATGANTKGYTTIVGAGQTTQLAPTGPLVDANGNVLQQGATTSTNNSALILLAIAVVVVILIIYLQ